MMLTAQFLLGMAIALIGLPSETSGSAKFSSSIFLGVHIFISLGLLIGTVTTLRAAQKHGAVFAAAAKTGGAAVVITIIAGILTTITENNWWSYLMAAGFMASFLAYGRLYLLVIKSRLAAN